MNRYCTRRGRSRGRLRGSSTSAEPFLRSGSDTPRWARHHLYDGDYERRLLGGLLRDFEAARVATAALIAEHFFLPEHAVLFEAIRTIEAEGEVPSDARLVELLADRRFLSVVPVVTECLDSYVPSADGHRLPLLAGRILALAGLRWLLRLADRMDSLLRDRRLDGSSRIEAAHKAMSEALEDLGVETERLAA
jgi:replicative DNA helicase